MKGMENMKLKHIRIACIPYNQPFESVNGSYYDYVATFFSSSEEKELAMKHELTSRGWREIPTNNRVIVFVQERHIVRILRIWD